MARLTFLGTGTSQGVPVIGCQCEVCQSTDPKDKRLRSSVALDINETSIVIDTGPDFRQQMLRDHRNKLDAILYTHGHKDHIAGLDDVRAYNFIQQSAMDLYLDEHTEQNIRQEFSYVFAEVKYPGIPEVVLHRVRALEDFIVEGIKIIPIRVMHAKLPVMAYRIGNMSYVTDANHISPESIEAMRGSDILILNALRHDKHVSHFTLEEALEISEEIGAPQTYLTHISHQLGRHNQVSPTLPEGVQLAYDGLVLDFKS